MKTAIVNVTILVLLAAAAWAATLVKTTSYDGDYTVVTFTTSDATSSASGTWTVPAGVTAVDVLVVGGGGGGGAAGMGGR